MPEGPEIRIEADAIRAAVGGRIARKVYFAFARLKRFQSRLSGAKVSSVRARGKAILIGFAGGYTIYSHNQLYGRWQVCADGEVPETGRQLRLAIHGARRAALLYSASEIQVLKSDAVESHPYIRRLGPDVLNQRVGRRRLSQRFLEQRFARRSLASLFLDQGFVAGIGNYLRSEILFAAGVHPARRPADLEASELHRLADAVTDLVRQSYRTRGITNDLALARELQAKGVNRAAYRFAVFDRQGEPCFNCGEPIRRRNLAGRRCYFCPSCQPLL
ncbi:MAG: endonuclease VIII [Gammaproteobacteria bacterium]|nr:endonuclease VIII [Gammaproteobacteria bacterium]